MRGRSIIARIDIVQVRAEGSLRLRLDDSIVEPVDEVGRRRLVPVVLEDPEAVAVVVRGEVGVLGVDGRAGAAVQVDDGVVLGSGALDVVEPCVETVGGEAGGLGDGDGLGEEVLVLVVAGEGFLDLGLAGDEDEVVVPAVGLDGGCASGGHGADELGLDLSVEVVDATEVGTAQAESTVVVHVDSKGDLVVDDGSVLGKLLEMEPSIGPFGLGVVHVAEGESEVGDARGGSLSLEVEVGDYADRVSRTTDTPEDVRVLSRRCLNERSVGKDNISGDDLIHCETPVTRSVAVTAVSKVSTDTNTGTGSVR